MPGMIAGPTSLPELLSRITWDRSLARPSVSDDFDQDALSPAAVERAVENLLPGTEVELATSDRHHHFAAHDLSLHVRVRVVLAGAVVKVLSGRLVRRQFFEPTVIILVQSGFIVIDENRRGDVHG